MIEAYAFLAAFAVQVLGMSVLFPAWQIRYFRAKAMDFSAERFAQLYPGVDLRITLERYLTRYRVMNLGVALLGLLLLGWFSRYTHRADWDDDVVRNLACFYFFLQALPICIYGWIAVRGKGKVLRHSLPEPKRSATLQRRGLFDFVSPFVVFLAVLSYLLFAAFVIYIEQHRYSGFGGAFINLGALTLMYALNAIAVYTMLYGKKINRIETQADSVHMIGLAVKVYVYACIVYAVFFSLTFTLELLDLPRWEPFLMSVFFVVCAFLSFVCFLALPRQPGANVSRQSEVPS